MKEIIRHHLFLKSVMITSILIILSGALFWLLRTTPVNQNQPVPSLTSKSVTSATGPDIAKHLPITPPKPMVPNFTIPAAEDGMAPVIYRIPTNLPVVYLGIDDGAHKTQQEVDLLAQNHIKATLFLSDLFIASDPDFFKAIIAQGSVVEDHTLSHNTNMQDEPYEYQKQEICGMADHIQQYYGRRPTLFRPPGGAYSDTMRRAAYDCGMKAVVTWIAKANGGSMQYQVGDHLRPGDIVLMHFRPEFAQDLQAFVDAMKASGLHTELLESLPGAV